MDAQTQALGAVVLSIIVFSVVVQRARAKLTREQLFSLERVNRITIQTLVPVLPLAVALPAVYVFGVNHALMFWAASPVMVLLFAFDTWRTRRKLDAAGLPRAYVNAHFLGLWILLAGLVVAMVLLARGMNLET